MNTCGSPRPFWGEVCGVKTVFIIALDIICFFPTVMMFAIMVPKQWWDRLLAPNGWIKAVAPKCAGIRPIPRHQTLNAKNFKKTENQRMQFHVRTSCGFSTIWATREAANTALKIINFIKAWPLGTLLFSVMCDKAGSTPKTLPLPSEVPWLSVGKAVVWWSRGLN